jgi:hypothetical protein
MFISMGLLGIVVAIVWYTVYREVAEAALSPGEAHHLTEGKEEPPPAQRVTLAEWRQLFGFRVETPSNVVAVMAISAAVFFAGGASGMSWALASVAAPAHCTASLGW